MISEQVKETEPGNGFHLTEVVVRLSEGRRLYSDKKMDTAQAAMEIIQEELAGYDREVLCIVNLDTHLRPINFNLAAIGSIDMCIAYIPNILKTSILSNAYAFLLCHNHPANDLEPSRYDLELTEKVILAGQLMNIPCIDHVIIGNRKEYYSMREHGTADFSPGYEKVMEGAKSLVAETQAAYADPAMYDTPFGEFDPAAYEQSMQNERQDYSRDYGGDTRQERSYRSVEEVSLKFGKGLCSFFAGKDGQEMAAIRIPSEKYDRWPQFVVPARIVHENRYGKGLWMKIPADGNTRLSVSKRIRQPDGREDWTKEFFTVSNRELKDMVEAYKSKDRSRDETKEGQQRPRARSR